MPIPSRLAVEANVVAMEATNLMVEEVVLNVANKATSSMNALINLVVEMVWTVILNARNGLNKEIYLVNVEPNV